MPGKPVQYRICPDGQHSEAVHALRERKLFMPNGSKETSRTIL